MDIYLPIAEVSVNAPLLLALGAAVGFISGLFGIGGGFLMTPILVFMGIPAPVAVASEANHVVASSVSGVISYGRKRAVDFRMGGVMALGGATGAFIGVELFRLIRLLGQADLVVSLSYLVFLGVIGALMLSESLQTILRRRRGETHAPRQDRRPFWLYGLPLKMRFRKSRLYISVIPPALVGFGIGLLSAVMGVGGGFMLVPAMIYLLGMPTSVVIGTSLFQVVFVAANVTLLAALQLGTVDLLLTLLLLLGGVAGAQFGAAMGTRLRGEEMRALLGLLVLSVAMSLLWGLLRRPPNLFSSGPAL